MSLSSQRKGNRRELELAHLLPGAVKISRARQSGPDVWWQGQSIEVKARANGFRELHKWLARVDLLALKADRRPWLIVCTLDTFLEMSQPPDSEQP